MDADGEFSTVAANLGRSEAQAEWLGSNISSCLALMLLLPNELGELLQWQFTARMTTP